MAYREGVEWSEIDREDLRNLLNEIGSVTMPFGKYGPKEFPPHGVPLHDLPPEYLAWFHSSGFPSGRLGELLKTVYEIKACGADLVFDPLRAARGGRYSLRKPRARRISFGDEKEKE